MVYIGKVLFCCFWAFLSMTAKKGSFFALFGCPTIKKGPKMRPFFALFEKNAKKKSKFRKKGLQKRPFWLLRPFFFKKKDNFLKNRLFFTVFRRFKSFQNFVKSATGHPKPSELGLDGPCRQASLDASGSHKWPRRPSDEDPLCYNLPVTI